MHVIALMHAISGYFPHLYRLTEDLLPAAATYDVLLDSDGDYFVGAWQWDNCLHTGGCPDVDHVGERIKIGSSERKHFPPLMDGFGYYFSTATLENAAPYRR